MDAAPWLDPLAVGGLLIGLALGATIQASRFCLVAAVGNARLMRDPRQVIGWLIALAIALAGTQFLEWQRLVEVAASGYRAPRLDWAGAALGGLAFGAGAMLAGGCAARTLAGAGEGNLGHWLTLTVFALVGWLVLLGPGEPWRSALAARTAVTLSGDASIAQALGLGIANAAGAAILVMLAAVLALRRRGGDASLAWPGAIVGVLVIAGWWVTGVIGPESMAATRPDSISLAGPLARTARLLATGERPASLFGVALVAGTLLGAFAMALLRGQFRLVRPPRDQALRALVGGALMGAGGAFAGGCNIGHGLTGLAALSIKSLIVVIAIVAGMLAVLAWLNRES